MQAKQWLTKRALCYLVIAGIVTSIGLWAGITNSISSRQEKQDMQLVESGDSKLMQQLAEERDKLEPVSVDNPPSPDNFRPKQRKPTAFPPITEVPVVSAHQAKDVDDAELVLGVVVNGKARAYPINMMAEPVREVFNDTLGGRAIAATW